MSQTSNALPSFICIETGDGALPVAVAWTLADGRVKHTLIQPLESWLEEEDIALGDYDEETLHTLGVRPLDVIRELEADHDGATLYVNGVGEEFEALERLFDEYSLDPMVELAPAHQLYAELDAAQWEDERRRLLDERGLTPLNAEHEVEVMLLLHQRFADQLPDDFALDDESFG
ncbi:hypothetical protein [Halotalea alkalilenta]|uniref:hypothetical protein n=1 Tax=Halotalea alkalilenta TaxID=376489 RepID=UPI0006934101|nr:hypothetical protein [Halotalea alkalilenta]